MIGKQSPRLTSALLLCLTVSHVYAASLGGRLVAPAVFWGPGPYIRAGVSGEQSRVSYQAASGDGFVRGIVQKLVPSAAVNGFDGAADVWSQYFDVAAAAAPDVVVVFVGSQVQSSVLRGAHASSLLQPLQQLLTTAAASLTVPHVHHSGDDVAPLSWRIGNELHELANKTHAFDFVVLNGCDGDWEDAQGRASLSDVLRDQDDDDAATTRSRPTIVLQCSTASQRDVASSLSSRDAAADEVSQLVESSHALEQSGQRYAVLFIVDPQHESAQNEAGTAQRTLLSASDASTRAAIDYGVCDAKCRAQVGVMEALMLAVILSVALAAGLWLQYILHTPTRFQAPSTSTD